MDAAEYILSLPLHPTMDKRDLDRVLDLLPVIAAEVEMIGRYPEDYSLRLTLRRDMVMLAGLLGEFERSEGPGAHVLLKSRYQMPGREL